MSTPAIAGKEILGRNWDAAVQIIPMLIAVLRSTDRRKKNRNSQIRIALLRQTRTAIRDMKQGRRRKHVCMVGWAARNLLELLIWSEYISRSEENVDRFWADVMLDNMDVAKTISTPRTGAPKSEVDAHCDFMEALKRARVGLGVPENERFLHIRKVALEVGLGYVYDQYYPILSKVTHQTASVILIGPKRYPGLGGYTELMAAICVCAIAYLLADDHETTKQMVPPWWKNIHSLLWNPDGVGRQL